MTRVIVGDLRTGRRYLDVPFVSASWSRARNRPETLTAKVSLLDPEVRALGLRNVAAPGKSFLAILEGDRFVGAGPVWAHDYARDDGTLEIQAAGIWSYLNRRTVQTLAAGTLPSTSFVIPDPADATKTIPNPVTTTMLSGLSLGTIAKRLIQQAASWPGGNLPIVYPGDEAGTHAREYLGLDFKSVGEAIADLTQVENGPDVELVPRFTADGLGVEWVLRTGTEAAPVLRSTSRHRWDLSVAAPSATSVKVKVDSGNLSDVAWLTGGRSADTALVERFYGTTLTAAGYPLLETVDSSHSSVSERNTLRSYAAEYGRLGRKPGETWSFDVRADESPRFGEYGIGDLCVLKVRNDPYIPDGDNYVREIAALSGDAGPWITVTTTETLNG